MKSVIEQKMHLPLLALILKQFVLMGFCMLQGRYRSILIQGILLKMTLKNKLVRY